MINTASSPTTMLLNIIVWRYDLPNISANENPHKVCLTSIKACAFSFLRINNVVKGQQNCTSNRSETLINVAIKNVLQA